MDLHPLVPPACEDSWVSICLVLGMRILLDYDRLAILVALDQFPSPPPIFPVPQQIVLHLVGVLPSMATSTRIAHSPRIGLSMLHKLGLLTLREGPVHMLCRLD